MSNINGFLSQLGFKQTAKGSEWLLPECFYCGGKDKLYFNSGKLIGYCQKCCRRIFLRDIAADLAGVPLSQITEFVEEQRIAEAQALGFRDAVTQNLLGELVAPAVGPLEEIPLPPSFRTLEDGESSVIGRRALAYLTFRGFRKDVLFRLGFGYCDEGKYGNRVIIPFWEDGRLVYWQARDFTGKVPLKSKILNPDDAPHGKSDVLFNYDSVKETKHIVVCESWGSALAVSDKYATALNGKTLSDAQKQKLLQTDAEYLLILLDHGAEEEAWKVAQQLYLSKPTMLAFLPYGDPNEVDRHVLLNAMKDAVDYSPEQHIKFLAMRSL